MPVREFDLIRWIARVAGSGPGVRVGIGDDCAVLEPGSASLLAKADALVEGVDFTHDAAPAAVGRKAANVNFSDIASMGGEPRFLLSTLCIPPGTSDAWTRGVVRGIVAACREAGATLVGGDLSATRGPAVLSMTALGSARRPVLRSGARPGDAIGITGPCGGSILGRHLTFRPRISEGKRLAGIATAMIDVSDGLSADLSHVLKASGVAGVIGSAAVPIHADARRLARRSGRAPIEHALSDGEDFELIFTCPPKRFPKWAHRLGTVERGSGLLLDGRPLRPRGYEHVLG